MRDSADDIYYKIYKNNGKYGVVCMQWFDEYDYNEDNFLRDKNGEVIRFDSYEGDTWVDAEKNAKEFLNRIMKKEFIHEEDALDSEEDVFLIPREEW